MTQVCKFAPKNPKDASCCNWPIDNLLQAEVFKALTDPTRVSLLACLAKCSRPCSVSEVAECCSVDLSVVSRHLRVLEDCGVLKSQKNGRVVWYEVRYQEFIDSLRALAGALESCCLTVTKPRRNRVKKKK